jgi:hypothetical protein
LFIKDSNPNIVLPDRQSPRRQRRRWSGPVEDVIDALQNADLCMTSTMESSDCEQFDDQETFVKPSFRHSMGWCFTVLFAVIALE